MNSYLIKVEEWQMKLEDDFDKMYDSISVFL